ncbi:MAG: SPFH domain-containing protein [Chloroflexota bacterium]|nr:SPFH domain-containing protein [Chloroflexota bacterium]
MAGFHTVGPNHALIVSGGSVQPKLKVGGRMFVLPILQKAQMISLEVMTLQVNTARVYTKEGVSVSVDGVAQVKVGRSQEAIRTAAEQFLGKSATQIAEVALQTLEGQQRAILGTMTVEDIYRDRVAFAEQVRDVAATDMTNMGLEIVSFSIRDIQDEQGYLEALGVRRTAEVKRDAAIGEAQAERDAGIKEASADQQRQAARFEADTAIAASERDFQTQKAAYDQQVNARTAEAELAYSLQEAKTRQQIRGEELQIEVVERQKQIEVQQQEIIRRERELDATVRRPAEAERDQLELIAEGNRRRIRVESEAERYKLETVAEGERSRIIAEAQAGAESIRLRGQADADAIRARGEAEADAIRAQGLAEAQAMNKKAAAWKEYGQAAMIQQLFDSLPDVAGAVAEPLAKTDSIVVISNGGDSNSGAGASKVTQDVSSTIAQLPALVQSLTGVDLISSLKNLPGIVSDESAQNGAVEAEDSPSEDEK